MNNTFLIRISAIAAAVSLVALASTAAAGRLPRPLGAGEQPLSAGVHVLDLVSREQGRPGYTHFPRIAITLPSGWFNYNGWGLNDGNTLSVSFWDVDKVYPTGCRWQGKPKIDPGRTVDGLARVLATRPLRHASRPTDVVLAGFHGKYLRWSVPSKLDFSRCGQGYFESWRGRGWATDRWQQAPGQIDRLWILDVKGKRLVVDASRIPTDSRTAIPVLDRIVHSIKFVSASPPRDTASEAGQSKSAWHRNTWNETQAGVVHAYFLVPPHDSRVRLAAILKVKTPATKLRLSCRLRLGGIWRPGSWNYYEAYGHIHAVSFPLPSPLRRSVPGIAVCHTSARIDAVWKTVSGPTDLDALGRYYWVKLRRT